MNIIQIDSNILEQISHGNEPAHQGELDESSTPFDLLLNDEANHAQSGEHPHPDDPGKQSEHLALLALVPHDQATHVAINNGNWFDASTWATGQIPGDDARVLIPTGITVAYNGISDANLYTLRVDGQLDFATDQNTQLKIDTFVVSPTGTLTVGTLAKPVEADVKAHIIIANNGIINTLWDPQQLSRGLISHGAVAIHGQAKTSHLKVAIDPAAGDSTLLLEAVPINWQVGDRIILTGTRYVPYELNDANEWTYQGTEDEVRMITAIAGNQITLDQPLDYDHDTPNLALKAYVANQTRNVLIETEHADILPASQRGHVMLMHSDDIDVRYAEFRELGRTDKSQYLDDFATEADSFRHRLFDDQGNPIVGERHNIRGRYALHLHRTGVNGQEAPAVLVGNSVDGSPGWGIVQHDSYAILENNLTYNVTGAGFVSETGNEIGAWRNNISIRNEGHRNDHEKTGVGNHDLGFEGHGFWLQGRLVENQGNVTAGNRGSGIFYFHRGVDQRPVDASNLPIQAWAKGQPTVDTSDPPITGFANNEVFASSTGLTVIKDFQKQEHDGRTMLVGFTAWEVAQGTNLEYTGHYTLKDFTLIGAETVQRDWLNDGVHLAQNTEDIVFDGLQVVGFAKGVRFDKEIVDGDELEDWGYVFVEPLLVNNQQDWVNFDPEVDRILERSEIIPGQLSFALDVDKSRLVIEPQESYYAAIEGIKTDSLGTIEASFGSEYLGFRFEGIYNLAQQGYYTLPDGRRGIVVDEYFSDRITGDLRKYSFLLVYGDEYWTKAAPNLGPLDPARLEPSSELIDRDAIAPNYPSFIYESFLESGADSTSTGQTERDDNQFSDLALTGIDAAVDFDWDEGAPDDSIWADTLSVRWTDQIQPPYPDTSQTQEVIPASQLYASAASISSDAIQPGQDSVVTRPKESSIEQSFSDDGDTVLYGGLTPPTDNHDPATVNFEFPFEAASSVIAKLESFPGNNTSNLPLDEISEAGFGVRVQAEKSSDGEFLQPPESVSFLALDNNASGILTGIGI